MQENGVLALYQGEQADGYWRKCRSLPSRVFWKIARLRAKKFQPYVGRDAWVLEYGVGPGYNLAALDCKVKYGYDIHETFKEILQAENIRFCQTTEGLAEGAFDLIICHHTLEHVADPWAALHEMKRLLWSGSTLLLSVPYERERKYRYYVPSEKNHHLFSWNPQTLGALVSSVGFRIVSIKVRRFAYDRFAAVVADNLGLGDWFYRFLRRTLLLLRPAYEIQMVLKK